METVSTIIKQSIPNYLSNAPVPNSIGGWFRLGVRDWLALVPLGAVCGGITYLVYAAFCPVHCRNTSRVNYSIDKRNPKVVHVKDIEDLGDSNAFCRCWKSKTFPMCDGSHTAHNETTGDNVGPVVIKKKK